MRSTRLPDWPSTWCCWTCVRASGPTAELIARLDLPLAQGDAAATVVTGTVIEHAPQDHICVRSQGQLLLVSPQTTL
jgi:molybdate transport system ATP-binding protein